MSAERTGQNSATAAIVMAVVVVGVLYFARDVLVPIVLAVLMSFVLAPLIALLQRLRCPRILAVFLVVLAALSVLFALGGLMAAQVNQLASDLPVYQSTLREKIQPCVGPPRAPGHSSVPPKCRRACARNSSGQSRMRRHRALLGIP